MMNLENLEKEIGLESDEIDLETNEIDLGSKEIGLESKEIDLDLKEIDLESKKIDLESDEMEKTNPEKKENFEFVEDLSYTETFEETNTDNLDKSTKDDTTWQNMDYCSKVNIWQNMNTKMNKIEDIVASHLGISTGKMSEFDTKCPPTKTKSIEAATLESLQPKDCPKFIKKENLERNSQNKFEFGSTENKSTTNNDIKIEVGSNQISKLTDIKFISMKQLPENQEIPNQNDQKNQLKTDIDTKPQLKSLKVESRKDTNVNEHDIIKNQPLKKLKKSKVIAETDESKLELKSNKTNKKMGRPTKEILKNRPLKKPLKRLRRSNRSKSLSEMATKDLKKVELRSKNAKLDKKRKNKMVELPSKRPRRSVTLSENDSKVLELNSNDAKSGRNNENQKLEATPLGVAQPKNKKEELPSKRPRRSVTITTLSENDSKVLESKWNDSKSFKNNEIENLESTTPGQSKKRGRPKKSTEMTPVQKSPKLKESPKFDHKTLNEACLDVLAIFDDLQTPPKYDDIFDDLFENVPKEEQNVPQKENKIVFNAVKHRELQLCAAKVKAAILIRKDYSEGKKDKNHESTLKIEPNVASDGNHQNNISLLYKME